jgi:hypothetical protein
MRAVMFVLTAVLLPVAMVVTAFKYAMDSVDQMVRGAK